MTQAKNKPLPCYYALGGINLKNGFATSCPQQSDHLFLLNENFLPSQILNSPGFIQHRLDLMNGDWPLGCRDCQYVEELGVTESMRLGVEPSVEHYDERTGIVHFDGLKTVEIRFSNLCNMSCLHCSQTYSSGWFRRLKHYTPSPVDFDLKLDQLTNSIHKKEIQEELQISLNREQALLFIQDLNLHFPNIERVDFAGGEVLLQDPFYPSLMELAKHPNAQNMQIMFHTNLNANFNTIDLCNLLSPFKEITLMVSVDAGKNIYPYFRGGDWSKLQRNINEINRYSTNIKISLVCTTSIYQIMDIENIFTDLIHLNGFAITASIVHTPSYLNPSLIMLKYPKEALQDIQSARNNINLEYSSRLEALEETTLLKSYSFDNDQNKHSWNDIETALISLNHIENYIKTYSRKEFDWVGLQSYIRRTDNIWRQKFNDYFSKFKFVNNTIKHINEKDEIPMFSLVNRLYKTIDDAEEIFLTRISNLDIPFSKNWNYIGVNLSGGADSAIMTYLLAKIIQNNKIDCRIDVITFIRCWDTRPWQSDVSLNIYNYLKKLFPEIIGDRHTTFIPPEIEHGRIGNIVEGRSADQIIVGSFNRYIADYLNLNAIYNGTTLNYNNSANDRMKNRDLNLEEARLQDVFLQMKDPNFAMCRPFSYVKKDWIVAQYYIHDLEDLYHHTRSCEGDLELIRRTFPDFEYNLQKKILPPTCNRCYWCQERKWADAQREDTIKKLLEGH